MHCLDAFFRAHPSLDLEHAPSLDLPSVLHPVQIEGVTPPSAESLPSQILEPETLLSEEGEDHREVCMYVVVPRVITWPSPLPLLIGCSLCQSDLFIEETVTGMVKRAELVPLALLITNPPPCCTNIAFECVTFRMSWTRHSLVHRPHPDYHHLQYG